MISYILKSIVNLFRGDDHNRNNDSRRSSINRSQQQLNDATNNVEYNAFTEYKNSQDKNKLKAPLFTSFPGKNNFTTKSSFKAPSVWNCDWNLNNIPEMNLKYVIGKFLTFYKYFPKLNLISFLFKKVFAKVFTCFRLGTRC